MFRGSFKSVFYIVYDPRLNVVGSRTGISKVDSGFRLSLVTVGA